MKSIMQLEPAGCDGKVPSSSPEIIAEEKIDGHRGLLHIGGDLDRGYLTGRRISKVTGQYVEKGLNVPQIIEIHELWKENGWGYTVIDGEITVPGYPFEAVQSVMGSKPERAISWQRENAFAHFTVFDMLFNDGKDIMHYPRDVRGGALIGMLAVRLPKEHFSLVPTRIVKCDHDQQTFFDKVVEAGGEGLVLKTMKGSYGVGQKKMKKEKTYDVVITGFTKANEGKYYGLIGALEFGAYKDGKLSYVGKCSGMTDAERMNFTNNQGSFLGKVVEVKSNGLTKKGVLRHPRFLRMRPDKSPEECVI